MGPSIHRRIVLSAGAAGSLLLLLPPASACEFFAPNLRVLHPWTRATPAEAPFALVNMRLDNVTRSDRLIGVESPVAERAELVGPQGPAGVDLPIPEGRETVLGEAGALLRLVGLRFALEIARSYPLRLQFEHGGTVNATLNVDYARFL
jgi:hypothetical protein